MDFDFWFDEIKGTLIKNPEKDNGDDGDYLWDGDFRETWNRLFEISKDNPKRHCYTLIECDGELYIVDGWRIVNRLGYYISKGPVEEGLEVRY